MKNDRKLENTNNENANNQLEGKIKYSRRHRVRINRIFREKAGIENIPYPEVDNIFERVRSKIVIKFSK